MAIKAMLNTGDEEGHPTDFDCDGFPRITYENTDIRIVGVFDDGLMLDNDKKILTELPPEIKQNTDYCLYVEYNDTPIETLAKVLTFMETE